MEADFVAVITADLSLVYSHKYDEKCVREEERGGALDLGECSVRCRRYTKAFLRLSEVV